ncbi:MAG: hypothetical protein WC835_03615 [Candidatus Paceibacterota bacterium]|jgi:hypothetical protein
MEYINLILDLALIVVTAWTVKIVAGFGGFIGKALDTIGWGTVVLGVSYFVYTLAIYRLGINTPSVLLAYRLVVLFGFILLLSGFKQLIGDKKTKAS